MEDYSSIVQKHRKEVLTRFGIEQIEYIKETDIDFLKDRLFIEYNDFKDSFAELVKNYQTIENVIYNLEETNTWNTAGGIYTQKQLQGKLNDIAVVIYDIQKCIEELDKENNFKKNKEYEKEIISFHKDTFNEWETTWNWMVG